MKKQAGQFERFRKLVEEVENKKLNSADRKPPERAFISETTKEENTKGKKENDN